MSSRPFGATPLNNTSLSYLVHQDINLSIIMTFHTPEFLKPATGVYLFRNASGKTMIDLINGGQHEPCNAVQAYEKVSGASFRNQYWYTVPAGDDANDNAYNIINIRTNTYLHLYRWTDCHTEKVQYHLTVKEKAVDADDQKRQEWLFRKSDDGYHRIQNVFSYNEDPLTGFLTLNEASGDNLVPIVGRLYANQLTQEWRLINRTRTSSEIEAIAEKGVFLKGAKNLLPSYPYLQIPNQMFLTIYKDAVKRGDIPGPNDSRFDKQHAFAFKDQVNKWANENLKANQFYMLTGMVFGVDGENPASGLWGLKDDDLNAVIYFITQNVKLQVAAPAFTAKNAFF
ncbi:hypothetical protein FRB94_002070 [Tulasnella sp. JGI-2019a]|nr:hypothetical protein FRB94_002070 [Tulasnella sp. JGI-2019a]